MTDSETALRASLLDRRDEILDAARAHHARKGRGGLVAVHADGLRQFVFYRTPDDLDAPDPPGHRAPIREAVRTYDPEREAVVFVADSAPEVHPVWSG